MGYVWRGEFSSKRNSQKRRPLTFKSKDAMTYPCWHKREKLFPEVLYKSHRKRLWRRGCGSRPVFRRRGAAKVRRICTKFQQTRSYAPERGTLQNFCQRASASTLSLFIIFIIHLQFHKHISIQNRHLDPGDTPGRAAEHQSATCARKSIIIVKEGHFFLSRAQHSMGAAAMDALSITQRLPAATIISYTVQRWADLNGHASDYIPKTAADNGYRHMLGQNKGAVKLRSHIGPWIKTREDTFQGYSESCLK